MQNLSDLDLKSQKMFWLWVWDKVVSTFWRQTTAGEKKGLLAALGLDAPLPRDPITSMTELLESHSKKEQKHSLHLLTIYILLHLITSYYILLHLITSYYILFPVITIYWLYDLYLLVM